MDKSSRTHAITRAERREDVPIDRLIARIAARQRGVIGWHQMLAAGISPSAIEQRVATGRLHRVFRGVYLVGHAIAPDLAIETAALIVMPAGTVLSHQTAAGLARLADLPRVVDVTVITGRSGSRAGLRVHRAPRLDRRDVRVVRGLPITAAARTLVDLAGVLSPAGLERCYEQAQIQRVLRPAHVLAALARAPGRRGAGALRDLVIEQPTMTRSRAERRLLRALAACGINRPDTNVVIGDFEVDMLWRDARVVVEFDGWETHGTRVAFERDRSRDAKLQAAGYRVLRATWRRLRDDPEALAGDVAATIRNGLSGAQRG